MAEIAVINKDNTDYDIRDKKLADHTSASTDTSKVSSASSIMLEASDGSFVSVKRDSFVNAIRDVLGSSIVANTGGTSDVNTIPALTSSGGLKSVSTADIASVLGATNVIGIQNRGFIDRTKNNYFSIRTNAAYLIAFYPWAGDFAVYVLRNYNSPDYGGYVHRTMVTTSGNYVLSNSLQVNHVDGNTFNITGLDVSFMTIDVILDMTIG